MFQTEDQAIITLITILKKLPNRYLVPTTNTEQQDLISMTVLVLQNMSFQNRELTYQEYHGSKQKEDNLSVETNYKKEI